MDDTATCRAGRCGICSSSETGAVFPSTRGADPALPLPPAGASHRVRHAHVLTRRNIVLHFISWNLKHEQKCLCGV